MGDKYAEHTFGAEVGLDQHVCEGFALELLFIKY